MLLKFKKQKNYFRLWLNVEWNFQGCCLNCIDFCILYFVLSRFENRYLKLFWIVIYSFLISTKKNLFEIRRLNKQEIMHKSIRYLSMLLKLIFDYTSVFLKNLHTQNCQKSNNVVLIYTASNKSKIEYKKCACCQIRR